MRRLILPLASLLLLLSLVISAWQEYRRPQPVPLTPGLTGEVEYCLTCHSDLTEISPSHPVETFGCVLCHGGQRLALDADLAHSTMRGGNNPSDFTVVETSCGGANCHSGSALDSRNHIQRATTSIQATYASAIAAIRHAYGAQPDLTARLGIYAVQVPEPAAGVASLEKFDPASESNPSIQVFGNNCLTCHLSAPASSDGSRFDRFTGCSACHTPTQPADISAAGEGAPSQVHQLTTAISYTQCDTCHNRGNYDLRSMTFISRTDQPTDRLQDYYQPIAQFTQCEYTLDCIDCHTRTEAMGDGYLYSAKKDIQYVLCKTCHGTPTELPLAHVVSESDTLIFRLVQLNPVVEVNPGDTILVTGKGEPLWNTQVMEDGTYRLVGKATGQVFSFNPVIGSGCTQNGQDQSSAYCHTCHAVQR